MFGFPGWEQAFDEDLGVVERLYVRLFGVPVNGLRIRLRRVLPVTSVGSPRRILDAGCGIGVFTMELAKQHPHADVIGVELDDALVAKASRIAARAGLENCRFVQGDVTRLQFDEPFDLVVSVDNLEHVEDDVGAMRRLCASLSADGRLVVHVPGYYRRWPMFARRVNFDVPGHVRPGYTREELVSKLQRAGLVVQRSQYTYGLLETISNNVSYLISGADKRNRLLYAAAFPTLLGISYLGKSANPEWGAGLMAVAVKVAGADLIE